jgi:hypothetical protein
VWSIPQSTAILYRVFSDCSIALTISSIIMHTIIRLFGAMSNMYSSFCIYRARFMYLAR